jgi:hypothetical protein
MEIEEPERGAPRAAVRIPDLRALRFVGQPSIYDTGLL